ncbi:MAG: hypothetical protein RL139_271, partial [Gemmatimonadota bacterium]
PRFAFSPTAATVRCGDPLGGAPDCGVRRHGFTLAEVVLAVLLLTVGAGVVARDLTRGLTGIRSALGELEALRRAGEALDAFAARPCAEGDTLRIEGLPTSPVLLVQRRCR